MTGSSQPLSQETLGEFTMGSGAAPRRLDLFVLLSLLPPSICASRITTDAPDLQKSPITGKDTLFEVVHESGVHGGWGTLFLYFFLDVN